MAPALCMHALHQIAIALHSSFELVQAGLCLFYRSPLDGQCTIRRVLNVTVSCSWIFKSINGCPHLSVMMTVAASAAEQTPLHR